MYTRPRAQQGPPNRSPTSTQTCWRAQTSCVWEGKGRSRGSAASGSPTVQGPSISNTGCLQSSGKPASGNSLTGSARSQRRLSARRVTAMQRWQKRPERAPVGAIPLSQWKGMLSVGPKHAPARAFRSRRWRVSPLSGGRARPGPGPRGRSSGASWPGLMLTASRGGRCASPPGPAQGGSSARAAPRGARSARACSPAAAAPSPAPAAACLCCFL